MVWSSFQLKTDRHTRSGWLMQVQWQHVHLSNNGGGVQCNHLPYSSIRESNWVNAHLCVVHFLMMMMMIVPSYLLFLCHTARLQLVQVSQEVSTFRVGWVYSINYTCKDCIQLLSCSFAIVHETIMHKLGLRLLYTWWMQSFIH